MRERPDSHDADEGGIVRVGIVMGSDSDWPVMKAAAEAVAEFGVPFEADVVSAHRMPAEMIDYGRQAASRGLQVIIAGAGGAAHLPGVIASLTDVPVLGVPMESRALAGVDSLLSILQMPAGVPTATFGIGPAGAANAALFAVRILATRDPELAEKLAAYREELAAAARKGNAKVQARLKGTAETA